MGTPFRDLVKRMSIVLAVESTPTSEASTSSLGGEGGVGVRQSKHCSQRSREDQSFESMVMDKDPIIGLGQVVLVMT